MLINPSDGFNIKKVQFGFYPETKIDSINVPSSPKEKLAQLRSFFKNDFQNYEIVTKPLIETGGANIFVPHDGRLNFVNKTHKELFFKELKKLHDNNYLHNKCLYFYRKSDNCLLKSWLNQYKAQDADTRKEEKLIDTIFLDTMPKNIIIFPYLNEDFSKWPKEEKIRFYIFLKNAGGNDAVKNFDAYVAEEAQKQERSFLKWVCDKLDIAVNAVNHINIPERIFQKLDEIIMPKILNMPLNNKRYRYLYAYGCFIGMRNAANPVSILAGFMSLHKLPQLWDKLVSFFKMEGSVDDFVLTLGQVIGTAFGAPLGIKMIKLTTPKAISVLKGAAKKIKTNIKSINSAIDETFKLPERNVKPEPLKKTPTRYELFIKRRKRIASAKLRRFKKHSETNNAENIKRLAQTKKPVQTNKPKNIATFDEPEYMIRYKVGKVLFEQYKKLLHNKSKHPNKKQINDQINNLRKKTLRYLIKTEQAKPPADISFENNWRLCVLRIHSHNWDGAISHFLQMLKKYKTMKLQNSLDKLFIINDYNKRLKSLKKSTASSLERFRKSDLCEKAEEKILLQYEKTKKLLEAERNKKIRSVEKMEKYKSDMILTIYNKLKRELNSYINNYKKALKETEKAITRLSKYSLGIAQKISKTEKELENLKDQINSIRIKNGDSNINGIEEGLRKSLQLSDIEKKYTLKFAELLALQVKYRRLDANFTQLCAENARIKARLEELNKIKTKIDTHLQFEIMCKDI